MTTGLSNWKQKYCMVEEREIEKEQNFVLLVIIKKMIIKLN